MSGLEPGGSPWVCSLWEQPFNSAPWPPVWLPRLLFHWSSSQTVPLTLVLRLLASAELLLYWTSLPCRIISRTIWSAWTQSRWSPLAWSRMSLECIVETPNIPLLSWHCPCNLRVRPVLHWPVILCSLTYIRSAFCQFCFVLWSSNYSICSVLFDLLYLLIQCSIIQFIQFCFLSWYWNCIPGILIPSYRRSNLLPVKHQTYSSQ